MPCIRQLQLYPAQRMSAHTWHQNNPSTRIRPQNRHSKVTIYIPYKRYVYAAWFEKCIITTFCSFDNSVTYQKMVCLVIKCSVFVFKCQGLVRKIMYRSGWLFLSCSRSFGFDKNTATKCVANTLLPGTQSANICKCLTTLTPSSLKYLYRIWMRTMHVFWVTVWRVQV